MTAWPYCFGPVEESRHGESVLTSWPGEKEEKEVTRVCY
jgi:hypothetical protein